MSEQPESPSTKPIQWPQGIEWLWWAMLVVSLAVGFGMTIFAPI
ncbi:MAG: hypothetical protein ACREJC_01585 [Tepidisphaeraceae bacterium]